MKSAIDVAAHILNELGDVSTMKLQKLVFYSQAYHLVRHGQPLFYESIEAWINGPVVPALYELHKGRAVVSSRDAIFLKAPASLSSLEQDTVDKVISCLGSYSGSRLSALTHSEKPWCDARAGLNPNQRSRNVIDLEAINDFYSSRVCRNPLFV